MIVADLRQTGHPVIVAINKTDDKRAQDASLEVYRLGFDPVLEISAEHGQGVADLLDEIVKKLEMVGFRPGSGTPAELVGPWPPSRRSSGQQSSLSLAVRMSASLHS